MPIATQRNRNKKCRRPRRSTTTIKRKRGGTKELQQELAQNFQFLNDWVAAGQQGQAVPYSALFGVSDIITIYLHTKYLNVCPLVPLELKPELDFQEWYEAADPATRPATLQEYKDLVDPHDHANWNRQKFLSNLQLCLETGVQTIVVPLSLPEHLNMVIIKARTREIVLFEPYGHGAQPLTPEVNLFMEELTQHVNTFLQLQGARQFTYVSPNMLCPRRRKDKGMHSFYEGFQEMEEKYGVHMGDDDGGFCQLWSWFFAECVLANPDLAIQEVYRQAFDFLQQNDTRDFGKVIRGYFISINDTLRHMRLSIEKGVMEQFQGPRDLLLAFLKQEQLAKEQKPKIGPFNEIGPLKRKQRPTD
jgi:hypothetical protein